MRRPLFERVIVIVAATALALAMTVFSFSQQPPRRKLALLKAAVQPRLQVADGGGGGVVVPEERSPGRADSTPA